MATRPENCSCGLLCDPCRKQWAVDMRKISLPSVYDAAGKQPEKRCPNCRVRPPQQYGLAAVFAKYSLEPLCELCLKEFITAILRPNNRGPLILKAGMAQD